jgi:hypothetical protein
MERRMMKTQVQHHAAGCQQTHRQRWAEQPAQPAMAPGRRGRSAGVPDTLRDQSTLVSRRAGWNPGTMPYDFRRQPWRRGLRWRPRWHGFRPLMKRHDFRRRSRRRVRRASRPGPSGWITTHESPCCLPVTRASRHRRIRLRCPPQCGPPFGRRPAWPW